jgi:membrane protein
MNKKKMSLSFSLMFLLFAVPVFADVNSQGFAELFTSQAGSGSVVVKLINGIYFGLTAVFRGVSAKIGLITGAILLGFTALDIIKLAINNIGKLDFMGLVSQSLPTFVKNLLLVAFITIPRNYPAVIATRSGSANVKGTLFTEVVELMFGMFYKLGLEFFGTSIPGIKNMTPGEVGEKLLTQPMKLLKDTFSVVTLLGMFVNVMKIIILILCLWLASKIIATYIANIFSALMLSMFSGLFLIFLSLESTKSIGFRGISVIVVQSITVFMTVAMLGLSVQVMTLVTVGSSVSGLLVLGVLMLMMQQITENVSGMAQAITSGAGLGQSNPSAFMGLAGTMGMAMTGAAMWAGSKADDVIGDFKQGMTEADPDKTVLGKMGQGALNVGANSTLAKGYQSAKQKISNKAQYMQDMKEAKAAGATKAEAQKHAQVLHTARVNKQNADKALKEALRRKDQKFSIASGAGMGIAAGFLMQAISGNMNDTRFLQNFTERIKANGMSPEQIEKLRKASEEAGADLKYMEDALKAGLAGNGKYNTMNPDGEQVKVDPTTGKPIFENANSQTNQANFGNAEIDPFKLDEMYKNDVNVPINVLNPETAMNNMPKFGSEEYNNIASGIYDFGAKNEELFNLNKNQGYGAKGLDIFKESVNTIKNELFMDQSLVGTATSSNPNMRASQIADGSTQHSENQQYEGLRPTSPIENYTSYGNAGSYKSYDGYNNPLDPNHINRTVNNAINNYQNTGGNNTEYNSGTGSYSGGNTSGGKNTGNPVGNDIKNPAQFNADEDIINKYNDFENSSRNNNKGV